MEELVKEIGDLKYDALSQFLELLANKIQNDGEKDKRRNRIKLASNLFGCAEQLKLSKKYLDDAWVICEPYTK